MDNQIPIKICCLFRLLDNKKAFILLLTRLKLSLYFKRAKNIKNKSDLRHSVHANAICPEWVMLTVLTEVPFLLGSWNYVWQKRQVNSSSAGGWVNPAVSFFHYIIEFLPCWSASYASWLLRLQLQCAHFETNILQFNNHLSLVNHNLH